MNTFTDHPR